jgi:hypothetical protein
MSLHYRGALNGRDSSSSSIALSNDSPPFNRSFHLFRVIGNEPQGAERIAECSHPRTFQLNQAKFIFHFNFHFLSRNTIGMFVNDLIL